MKKTLLATILLLSAGLFYKSYGQCTFANPGIRVIGQPATVNGKCVINFELSFEISHNPGGKYFWVHIWPSSAYPNHGYATSDPPETSQIPGGNGALDNSLATFGFFHQGTTLTVQQSYPPDANAPGFHPDVTISEIEGGGELPDYDLYTVRGLTITLPQACNVPQPLTMDIWESQASNAQTVGCVTKNTVIFVNDPLVNGLLFCGVPREYSFTINSIRTTGSLAVTYEVFIDNGDGIFSKEQDSIRVNNGTATLDGSNSYTFSSGRIGYPPYSSQKPYADRDLWVLITSADIPNDIYARLGNGCIGLPVALTSFSAIRRGSLVELKWKTATEINNYGFYIERKVGNEAWQSLGFVASQSPDGNSNHELIYYFTDNNTSKVVSHYRLRQVDFDQQASLSETRQVKGMDSKGKIMVYPNPVINGVINVVADNMIAEMDIVINDMSGRMVKQLKNIATQRVSIPNLLPGVYTVNVFIRETGEKFTEKIVVE